MAAIDGAQLLQEHAAGTSFRDLGQRHGFSHEHARQLVINQLGNLVFEGVIRVLSPDLDNVSWIVPYQDQGDRATALKVIGLVRDGVRAKGVPVKTVVRTVRPGTLDNFGVPTPGGQVFTLTLDEDELDRRAAAPED